MTEAVVCTRHIGAQVHLALALRPVVECGVTLARVVQRVQVLGAHAAVEAGKGGARSQILLARSAREVARAVAAQCALTELTAPVVRAVGEALVHNARL